jgi:hypothetical protein
MSPAALEAVLMICPFCSQSIQELWQPFCAITDWQGNALPEHKHGATTVTKPGKRIAAHIDIQLRWAVCPKCRELIVKVCKTVAYASKKASTQHLAKLPTHETDWLALPQRKALPSVSNLIPDDMARDYREAYLIVEDSPRMSGVLARRILEDLLEKYAGLSQYGLAARIDAFIKDTDHPIRYRKKLHYLREIGDLAAHTKTDSSGKAIETDEDTAKWALDAISDLFDYLIVAPARDAEKFSDMDEKIKAAGRKPVRELGE